MTPAELRRDLARRWASFPECARPFVSNLIQQLKSLENGTGNPKTLPGLMEKQIKRIQESGK